MDSNHPQNYFPSDVLKRMKKNANPRMSVKLMQVCKYFQHKKFPFNVVKHISSYSSDWRYSTIDEKDFIVKKLPNNLWLTKSLLVNYCFCQITHLLNKIIASDVERMVIYYQKLSFNEFKLLTSSGNIKTLAFTETEICFKNGESVLLNDILKCVPMIVNLTIQLNVYEFHFDDTLVCSKLNRLSFGDIKENFNIEDFLQFMMKNQKVAYSLLFYRFLPNEYIERIHACVEKISNEWQIENRPPMFSFYDQYRKSVQPLEEIWANKLEQQKRDEMHKLNIL